MIAVARRNDLEGGLTIPFAYALQVLKGHSEGITINNIKVVQFSLFLKISFFYWKVVVIEGRKCKLHKLIFHDVQVWRRKNISAVRIFNWANNTLFGGVEGWAWQAIGAARRFVFGAYNHVLVVRD